jgi:hypothetical protein
VSDDSKIEWTGKAKRPQRAQPGPANFNWKGGRTVDPRGYVLIKMPGHPAADVRGYVYEHRLVVEEALQRLLYPGERIRHTDNDPGNNDLLNLRLITPLDRKTMTACMCGCGIVMKALDDAGRKRRYASGHNGIRGVREGDRPKNETAAGLDLEWRTETLADFGGMCAYGCGRPAAQWDHLIPWSQGGSFEKPGNAVPACRICNQSKSADPDPWKWIDRAMNSAQAAAMELVISLALEWGELGVAA